MAHHRLHFASSYQTATTLLAVLCGAAYATSRQSPVPRFQPHTNLNKPDDSVLGPAAAPTETDDALTALRNRKNIDDIKPSQQNHSRALSRLTKLEQSLNVPIKTGIFRYDVSQITSNDPTEDDHAEYIAPVPNGHWSFFGIYDGHNGWETSAWLRENLVLAVTGSLADLYHRVKGDASPEAEPSFTDIEATLKETFKRLDDDIVNSAVERATSSSSKFEAVNVLAPAHAGSCALLSFFDSHSHILHTAITGDSRAVLGRRVHSVDGQVLYEVQELTVEQNGFNAPEVARLVALHPGETAVNATNGRVLGWGITRAFGDARMKWTLEVQQLLKRTLLGRSVSSTVKTPPYFTAEPEVSAVEVRPGDFLVMASDGLWDCLTSAEAVGLVAWWMNRMTASPGAAAVLDPRELPIVWPEGYTDNTTRHRQWGVEKMFVSADENAATHLIRNSVGGANEDLVAALMSMRSPRSRSYFDDTTVTVVFFV